MYIKKFFKVLGDEKWRLFIVGWIKVVLLKRKFYSQKCRGTRFVFPDPLVFLWQFKEIYIDECYDMDDNVEPTILVDCGANVGMCSVYWAQKFPRAKIFAIEADPKIADLLKENLRINDIQNVTVINKAAWIKEGHIQFSLGSVDGGAINQTSSQGLVTLECFALGAWLNEFTSIDYLKIDIEGAETEIFNYLPTGSLGHVERIFIEYHQPKNEKSTIGKIISWLEEAGFSCFVSKVIAAPKSLNGSKNLNGNPFLAQCNIHGARHIPPKNK